ncbi:hypothetical protein TNCV_2562611 [Trichonephila clavipes]|uniref:Uncharacterized protein n=1 Tax=Trichonephila clavipes TaxID=2585209 RepID=A0A8X6UW67_TRICX|nr:hypothetical protein TNCV_2562611 [Trichonephila clavipes]
MSTFKKTRQVGNPDFPCIVHAELESPFRAMLVVAWSTIQVIARFGSFPSQFCGRTPLEWSEASHFSSPSINLTRGLGLDSYLAPLCHESPIHLQISMPCSGNRTQALRYSRQCR